MGKRMNEHKRNSAIWALVAEQEVDQMRDKFLTSPRSLSQKTTRAIDHIGRTPTEAFNDAKALEHEKITRPYRRK